MTAPDVLRQAATLIRQRATEANTDEARRPYSDRRIDPVPETQWGKLVDNYLGGEIGAHCAAWTPVAALAVADWLDSVCDQTGGLPSVALAPALAVAHAYLGGDQ
jgi:hypothetical protein